MDVVGIEIEWSGSLDPQAPHRDILSGSQPNLLHCVKCMWHPCLWWAAFISGFQCLVSTCGTLHRKKLNAIGIVTFYFLKLYWMFLISKRLQFLYGSPKQWLTPAVPPWCWPIGVLWLRLGVIIALIACRISFQGELVIHFTGKWVRSCRNWQPLSRNMQSFFFWPTGHRENEDRKPSPYRLYIHGTASNLQA